MYRYEKLIILFLCLLVFLSSSAIEKRIWRFKVLLTLKIFSENIYFKKESDSITVGTESSEFLKALERKKTVIKGVKIKPLKLSPTIPPVDMDVVYTNNITLAEKFAKKGILIFSSNEKCTDAAFIITINKKNKLKITYNKKNIKNQNAAFPAAFFKTIKKYNIEK